MTWYHIALVYNAKEHFIAYYVNGQLQSQDISYGKGATVDICGTPDCEFQIGRSYEDELRQLNGNIAEIRIWNTCRTKEEIWTNMYKVEDPENEESLLAYWKFNEGEGNIVKDHSKHGSICRTSCVADGNRNSTNQQVIIHFKDNHGHEKKYKLQKCSLHGCHYISNRHARRLRR